MSLATDSSRYCAFHGSHGDHHTDRCPADPNGYLAHTEDEQRLADAYDERVRRSWTTHDRTVHGHTADGHEIVRYDRAGKWYVETRFAPRRDVSLREAVRLAVAGTPQLDKCGGQAFDAKVRKSLSKRHGQ